MADSWLYAELQNAWTQATFGSVAQSLDPPGGFEAVYRQVGLMARHVLSDHKWQSAVDRLLGEAFKVHQDRNRYAHDLWLASEGGEEATVVVRKVRIATRKDPRAFVHEEIDLAAAEVLPHRIHYASDRVKILAQILGLARKPDFNLDDHEESRLLMALTYDEVMSQSDQPS